MVVRKKTVKKKATKKKVAKKKTTKKKAVKETVIGRPTKYDPAFCEKVVEVMEKGYSKEAVAGHLNIDKTTLYAWDVKYPSFSNAIKRGVELSRIFWEKAAIDNLTHTKDGRRLDAATWIFNMKNRFNWTDKKEVVVDATEAAKKAFAFDLSKKPEEVEG